MRPVRIHIVLVINQTQMDSISDRVAAALRIPLANRNRNRKAYTANVQAYHLYMKGNLHSRRLTQPDLQKGISYYEQAITADPNYALAYVELANAYRAITSDGEHDQDQWRFS